MVNTLLEISSHLPAAANVGATPAPPDVNTWPELPVATAAGAPAASYVIILPSVPWAILARVTLLSARNPFAVPLLVIVAPLSTTSVEPDNTDRVLAVN